MKIFLEIPEIRKNMIISSAHQLLLKKMLDGLSVEVAPGELNVFDALGGDSGVGITAEK